VKASKFTAIDFFDDLTSRYARNRFFAGFMVLVVGCLLIIPVTDALHDWPTVKEVSRSILVQVVSSSLVILAFYSLYMWLIGPNTAAREVSVARPQDISERMKALPLDVHHYVFWGRSGSFFRAYPLLKLDEEARDKKRNIVVDVLLPDPQDDRLVASYRDILVVLGEEPGNNPLLPNVLATCMACAILSANNKHLEIRIHLSSFLPGFRVDLSDNGAILTQDDKRKPALFFQYGSDFYDMFLSTVMNEKAVSRKVVWDGGLFRGLKLEEKSCDVKTLEAFGIHVGRLDAIQQEVATLITKRPHRY